MSPRCKPGDLAYILKSKSPENIGRVVLVIKQWHPGMESADGVQYTPEDTGEVNWHVEYQGSPGISRFNVFDPKTGAALKSWQRPTIDGVYRDSYLRPISNGVPDEDVETTRERELETTA